MQINSDSTSTLNDSLSNHEFSSQRFNNRVPLLFAGVLLGANEPCTETAVIVKSVRVCINLIHLCLT